MMYRVTALPSYVSRQRPVRQMHKCRNQIQICSNQFWKLGVARSSRIAIKSDISFNSLASEMELYEL